MCGVAKQQVHLHLRLNRPPSDFLTDVQENSRIKVGSYTLERDRGGIKEEEKQQLNKEEVDSKLDGSCPQHVGGSGLPAHVLLSVYVFVRPSGFCCRNRCRLIVSFHILQNKHLSLTDVGGRPISQLHCCCFKPIYNNLVPMNHFDLLTWCKSTSCPDMSQCRTSTLAFKLLTGASDE